MADEPTGNRRISGKLIAAIILAIVLIAFVFDNTRKVKVGFVVGDHQTRLIYVLIVTAVIGVLIDRLWIWHRNRNE
jgi:uncharacterized integral membrane protein